MKNKFYQLEAVGLKLFLFFFVNVRQILRETAGIFLKLFL